MNTDPPIHHVPTAETRSRVLPPDGPRTIHLDPIIDLYDEPDAPRYAHVRIRSGMYLWSIDPEPPSLCSIHMAPEDLLPVAFGMMCRLDGRGLAHFTRILFEGPYRAPHKRQPTTTLAELLGPKGILKVMAAIEKAQAWLPPLLHPEQVAGAGASQA